MKRSSLIQSKQKGFSLIEMMVAMLIGLIIIAAVYIVFLSSQKSYRLSTGMMQVNDNGQFLVQFLQSDFQKAGWVDTDVESPEGHSLAMPVKDLLNNQKAGNSLNSDQITVRYYANQACDGAAAVNGVIENTYQLVVVNDKTELQCNGIALASNVESFQLEYGVLTNNGIEYKDANGIADLSLIKTIRFAFIVASDRQNITSSKNSTINNVLGEGPLNFSDGRYRQVFGSTVVLNNRSNLPPESLLVTE
ncbi:MAG: PilW family protein [Gammaproteobacteria bacterium]|nr:PilW family protein [Gammaproteobacteria bacterium]